MALKQRKDKQLNYEGIYDQGKTESSLSKVQGMIQKEIYQFNNKLVEVDNFLEEVSSRFLEDVDVLLE